MRGRRLTHSWFLGSGRWRRAQRSGAAAERRCCRSVSGSYYSRTALPLPWATAVPSCC